MINFTKKEIEYIQKEMEHVAEIFNSGDIKELKNYISYVGGKYMDTALMFADTDLIKCINENEYINDKVIDFMMGSSMFVWVECGLSTAEEVKEFGFEKEYCQIYEKIINRDDLEED